MNVLLSDGLRDQQHVGLQLQSLLDELLVGNLAAQVVSFDHLVTLDAVVTGEALTVHDGVDTDGMSVSTGGSTHHDDLAADVLLDILVGLLHGHDVRLDGHNMDVIIVDAVDTATVDHVEGELLVQSLVESHVGLFQTHLLGDLAGSLLTLSVILDGQGEAGLDLTIVHGIAVRLQLSQVQGSIEISLMGIVQSGTHSAATLPFISSMKGLK